MRIDLDQINNIESISGKFKGLWQATASYKIGDIVVYDNNIYSCINNNSNTKPDYSFGIWNTDLVQTPFIFQVGGSTEVEHYHIAKLSILDAKSLIEGTTGSIDITSDTIEGHEHTITVQYDFTAHTFVVTNVTASSGSEHSAFLVGAGSQAIEVDYMVAMDYVQNSTLIIGQNYLLRNRAINRPNSYLPYAGLVGDILVKAVSKNRFDSEATLIAKVPDYKNISVWTENYIGASGVIYNLSTSAYTEINSVLGDNVNSTLSGDDSYLTPDLGFNFIFGGIAYTKVGVDTNGRLFFGNSGSIYSSTNMYAGGSPMIALVWGDLYVESGKLSFYTTGTSPNRKFVANYNAVRTLNNNGYFTGQIVLEETTNAVVISLKEHDPFNYGFVQGFQYASGYYDLASGASIQNGTFRFVPMTVSENAPISTPSDYPAIYNGQTWYLTKNTPKDVPGDTATWQLASGNNRDDFGNNIIVYDKIIFDSENNVIKERRDISGNIVNGTLIGYFPWGNSIFKDNKFINTETDLPSALLNNANKKFERNILVNCFFGNCSFPTNSFTENSLYSVAYNNYHPQSFDYNTMYNGLYDDSEDGSGVIRAFSINGSAVTTEAGLYDFRTKYLENQYVVYKDGVPISYANLDILQPTNSDNTEHDLIIMKGYFNNWLCPRNRDYNINGYGASVLRVYPGAFSSRRYINIAGLTVSDVFYMFCATQGSLGHVMKMRDCKLNAMQFYGNSINAVNTYDVSSSTIGTFYDFGGNNNQLLTISNSVLGNIESGAVFNGGRGQGSARIIISNSVIILRDTATLYSQSIDDAYAPIYKNVILIAADGSVTVLGATGGGGANSVDIQNLTDLINIQKNRIDNLTTGAPTALDTLAEIASQIQSDEQGVAAILATQQQHTQQISDLVNGQDIYNIGASLRTAIVTGNYNTSNELIDTLPAGSVSATKFSYKNYIYEYMPGDAGTLVWIRSAKNIINASPVQSEMVLEFIFDVGYENSFKTTIGTNQVATYSTPDQSNVNSYSFFINNSTTASSLPFELKKDDILEVKIVRSDSTKGSRLTITN